MRFLVLILVTLFSFNALAEDVSTLAPYEFDEAYIESVSPSHFKAKITSPTAVKMRCVAYNGEAPIAINSIAVYPPHAMADFYINETEGPVNFVKCWITSSRESDIEAVEKREAAAMRKRHEPNKSEPVPFYKM